MNISSVKMHNRQVSFGIREFDGPKGNTSPEVVKLRDALIQDMIAKRAKAAQIPHPPQEPNIIASLVEKALKVFKKL